MDITMDNIIDMVNLMPGNNVVYRKEKDGLHRIYYSAGVPELSGHTEEEFKKISIGNPFDLVLEEDRELINDKVGNGIQTNDKTIDLLYRLIHKEKGFVWVHMNGKLIGDIDGKPIFVASLLDVTKEMLNSQVLMEATDRYICVIEKSTKRILYGNGSFYDLIDLKPADAMGKHCYEVLCKSLEMKDGNCFCYSSINVDTPIETYNPDKNKNLTIKGREILWGEYEAYVFYMTDITAEKQKDEMLEDSRKRFNVALDNSDLFIWEYDMVNHRCINSEKAGRDYNLPIVIENYPESLYETDYVPSETIEQMKEVKRRLENGETGFAVERRTIDKDGKSWWQKVEYTLECDENGKPLRAIVCGLDITAQKEVELKYEEQMQYRNNLAKKALFSIRIDLDEDLILDYTCNEPHWDILLEKNPQASWFLREFFRPATFHADDEMANSVWQIEYLKEKYLLGQSQYQTTYQCGLLDKYLELNLTLYKNPAKKHLEAFFVITDVTEVRLMHTAFQGIVNKDYDYVGIANISTKNALFLAKTEAEFMPEQPLDVQEDYDEMVIKFAQKNREYFYSEEDYLAVSEGILLKNIVEKLKDTSVYEFNYKVQTSKHEIYTYRMGFSYVDEKRTQIMFARTNITKAVLEEQKNQSVLEEALKTARQANFAKTDFLSRMSHDMRTPMNGIIGMTKLTQDIPELPEEVQSNLAAIEDSGKYLLRLINDTLDMNKIESNKFTLNPEVINVSELMKHIIATITPMINQKQIKLEFVPINAELEYILADRVRVQQLCVNVLSNSIKFTPIGGTIRMEVECLKRENGIAYDRISVEDTGCGMSQEFLKHIFEPFTQEKNVIVSGQEGTGLGMAIVKNLVELMGGHVEIESEIGKGTKVTAFINFKRVYDYEKYINPAKNQVEGQLEQKRVLLVEDHPLNAMIAKRLLEKKGMVVEHAENGLIGVEMFKASQPNYYDVTLMDIRMPEMDGLEATRAIRAINRVDARTMPIIAMTANAYVEDVQAALEAGMNDHLAKPVEPEIMYHTIAQYVN